MENAELKSGGGDNVMIVITLEAASDATETTTGLLAEMRAVHAAQMRSFPASVPHVLRASPQVAWWWFRLQKRQTLGC